MIDFKRLFFRIQPIEQVKKRRYRRRDSIDRIKRQAQKPFSKTLSDELAKLENK